MLMVALSFISIQKFVFFFNYTTMGNYPLITGIAIRVTSFVAQ